MTTFTPALSDIFGIEDLGREEGDTLWFDGERHVLLRGRWWPVADLESGRVRVGGPGEWFYRITYSRQLWDELKQRQMLSF